MPNHHSFDIIIAGSGLAGLTTASILLRDGYKIAMVSPEIKQADGRSTAFLKHSVDFLKNNSIWDDVSSFSAPMAVMRIIDGTNRILRAPEMAFRAAEIGEEVFGYNILNSKYSSALQNQIGKNKGFSRIDAKIDTIEESGEFISVTTDSGKTLEAKLLVGADGRNSTCRKLANNGTGGAGIATSQWSYPQHAIVLNFEHTLPHHNASNEFHCEHGPFTQVPLEDNLSSLVWVETPQKAQEILELGKTEQESSIETKLHSILGKINIVSSVQTFPLGVLKAREFASGRIFLVGDAAHAMPPIGAQGFNLGIRDIECLQNLLSTHSIDDLKLANRYHNMRKRDIFSRTQGVDLLNRSLLSDFLPVQALRTSGLYFIGSFAPLRRLAIMEGLAPGSGLRGLFERPAA